jgi:hypothetical protein
MSQEKNWVYLEHDRELYLFYMFYPDFVVNKFVYGSDWEFKTVVDESLFIPGLDSIPFVSYSSSPVDYDESHYLLFVHARSSKTILDYIHWGVLLDKRSLRPVKMTRNPVIRGGAMRGTYPHVVFISGVVPRGADFILFMGEGDSYCSRCIITRKQLENNFITIHTEPRPS